MAEAGGHDGSGTDTDDDGELIRKVGGCTTMSMHNRTQQRAHQHMSGRASTRTTPFTSPKPDDIIPIT